MASGGIRTDLESANALTIGEKRTLRFTVTDENGDNVSDFTGWTFEFFLLTKLSTANGLTDLRADALIHKEHADLNPSVPDVDVPIEPADWPTTPRVYAYELWRVDSGNERRLAYGAFTVVA